MPTFRIRKNDWTSLIGTLSVRLYAIGATGIANGAGGDTLTLVGASEGLYEATVAEALAGLHLYVIYLDAFPIYEGTIDIIAASAIWIVDAEYPILSTDSGATELARGAGASFTILPGFFVNQRRNSANSIDLYLGETGEVSVPVIDANKDPLDLSAKTVTIYFADSGGTAITSILTDTSSPGLVSFTASAELTEALVAEGTFALRDDVNGDAVIVLGAFNVRFAP